MIATIITIPNRRLLIQPLMDVLTKPPSPIREVIVSTDHNLKGVTYNSLKVMSEAADIALPNEYILHLTDDVILTNGFLSTLSLYLDHNPHPYHTLYLRNKYVIHPYPETIDKDTYVLTDRTNTVSDIGFLYQHTPGFVTGLRDYINNPPPSPNPIYLKHFDIALSFYMKHLGLKWSIPKLGLVGHNHNIQSSLDHHYHPNYGGLTIDDVDPETRSRYIDKLKV